MRLDLPDLRLFLSIVEAGSITRGAERANLALASASERIKAMEREVGVALLQRRARGVIATEAGEALVHHARLMLQQQALLKSELEHFASGTRGSLSLLANTAALTHFLPARLASWLAPRPQLNLLLHERTSVEIVDSLASGVAEAGIVSDAVAAAGLQQVPLADDHLKLIVPPGHALAAHATVAFEDIINAPFVALADGNALQAHIDAQAAALGQRLHNRIHMKTFDGVCEMTAHGIGLAIVPDQVAQQVAVRRRLPVLALSNAWAKRRLCACYRHWDGLSAPMQSLLVHLGAKPGSE
jgi:DNA-binding transcriptional LysR family regulator